MKILPDKHSRYHNVIDKRELPMLQRLIGDSVLGNPVLKNKPAREQRRLLERTLESLKKQALSAGFKLKWYITYDRRLQVDDIKGFEMQAFEVGFGFLQVFVKKIEPDTALITEGATDHA